jgi:MFS family permease
MTADVPAWRNIRLLTVAQALGGAGPPIIVSLGGLVGHQLSPDPTLITLPVSLYNLGLALGTLPAAYLMRRLGRRNAYLLGAGFGAMGGALAATGVFIASFLVFCLGTFTAGFYAAYVQSYRFAAADGVTGSLRARAISWVMVGGLFAAIIGPQLVIWTREAIPAAPFAGSFLSQVALALIALPVLLLLRVPDPATGHAGSGGRPLRAILAQPRFMLAVASGVVSYGLMTFVMTAAPVAMVGHGHSVDMAALGIQWHILAMFAPSFVTGRLIQRFGKERIVATGLMLLGTSAMVALSGLQIGHFWAALVLLGIGWNFGFIGATTMVTDCYTPAERSKAQGANDFMVFGVVAGASFFSGNLLHASGWAAINWLVFPAIALVLVPLLWRGARLRPA